VSRCVRIAGHIRTRVYKYVVSYGIGMVYTIILFSDGYLFFLSDFPCPRAFGRFTRLHRRQRGGLCIHGRTKTSPKAAFIAAVILYRYRFVSAKAELYAYNNISVTVVQIRSNQFGGPASLQRVQRDFIK